MAGTILTMVLSSVCVVVVCAAANRLSATAAKISYLAPAASAASDRETSKDVGGTGVAVLGLR